MKLRTELLTLGDELLIGIRENTHLVYLGERLNTLGLPITSSTVFRDTPDAISGHFSETWERADIILTTGGLGPTADDNTRETIAAFLGRPLAFEPKIEAAIRERFKRMGRTMTVNNRKQCFVPEGAEYIPNSNGTAPGIWLEDAATGKLLIMLPGPRNELIPMFEDEVVPRLEKRGLISNDGAYHLFRTIGIGESALEAELNSVFAACEGIGVAFCAHQGIVDLRLSRGTAEAASFEKALTACREILGDRCLTESANALSEVVVTLLKDKQKTLAVAESCTGGMIADLLTDIPGASEGLLASIVAYSEQTKLALLGVQKQTLEKFSAVSAETAREMAIGIRERTGADFSLSTTGYAGPGGGTASDPVGTVYIALADDAAVKTWRIQYSGQRSAVKMRAANHALNQLRLRLLSE